VDGGGAPKSVDVQFLIDTGATQSIVAQDTLKNFKVTFAGAVNKETAAGSAAFTSFTGATLQIKASTGDLKYTDTFLANTKNEADSPSLIGQDLAKDQGAIYTIDTKGGKVTIST
jgi:hypothetical protein